MIIEDEWFNIRKSPDSSYLRCVLELVQDSLPLAKTGLFFVSFCVFEGA
jgi:hypothetical protein